MEGAGREGNRANWFYPYSRKEYLLKSVQIERDTHKGIDNTIKSSQSIHSSYVKKKKVITLEKYIFEVNEDVKDTQ